MFNTVARDCGKRRRLSCIGTRNPVLGGIMWNDHESKEQRRKLELYHDAGTWLSVLNHFPSSDPALLDQVCHWKPDPPACGKLLGTECDTHTHTRTDCVGSGPHQLLNQAADGLGGRVLRCCGVLQSVVVLDSIHFANHTLNVVAKYWQPHPRHACADIYKYIF